MFDFQVSKHPHYDEACRTFAQRHNMAKLAERAGMNVQTLRNKLNPEQPHQFTPPELWLLTDLTEDSTLVDGFLAQIHCLPCVPVNELAKDKLQSYVMRAMRELGELASGAVSDERLTSARKHNMIESVNAGIRMLSLSALALHARLQTNPAMSSVVDTMSGIGASFGLI
ncbi:phage regulatory CII family protein [Escherichia coli]|uniref:phage regulatory CII family protein n=1 Tax=Escherichia coli TaxID=562 RepID=UPI00287A6CFC|nr:phage regulatory CII family protein [Escherichia coli]ELT9803898.1 phage regulatory CII family protein [Escherichia coli]MDS1588403.1 phage regulatory CII family protein [Escherichia coli]HAW8119600.1 phage regulatory CII family protein [Escherichia coli]